MRDVTDLGGEVGRHEIHVLGQIAPGPGQAFDIGLPAEFAVGAHLARHARDFRGKRVELLDHRIDRVFEFEHLAFDFDGDLAVEVALGDGGGDFGKIADLGGEVGRHAIDVVGQVLPDAGDAGDNRLAAELAFGADFLRHA